MIDFTAPPEPDEPLSIVPFPVLDPGALRGLPGKIVEAVAPTTEAHPAAILAQYLARFGATVGSGPHVLADNRPHPARIFPLLVGKTASGAKGTSDGVVSAIFGAVDAGSEWRQHGHLSTFTARDPLRRVSGLSSGEGLIEIIRDGNGDDPNAKNFDEGVPDKRLLVVESEFTSMLSVMERQGSTLPRVVREAWDGDTLCTLTRSRLTATDPHIVIVGHVTPGELRLRLREAQVLGGTMNRFIAIASRRTGLLPSGGNVPREVLDEYAGPISDALANAAGLREVERTPAAEALWLRAYADLRRDRPDGPVASILARSAPQALRLSLAYALADGSSVIEDEHLSAALAIWAYVEDTTAWMLGGEIDNGEVESLIGFIAAAGPAGRTRTEISSGLYHRNKPAAEIDALLGGLMRDGRVRQQVEQGTVGRPAVRWFAC